MKNNTFFSLLAIFAAQYAGFAQGGLLLNDVRMTCSGTIKLVIENGRWNNSISTFDRGNSTVKFAGNASASNSVIEGNVTTFHDLEVAKSQNNLRLESNSVNVTSNLIFTSRNLDLNGKTVILGTGGSAGTMSNENVNSRTYSSMPASNVTKTRSISNPANFHFGNMGIRMTATGSFGNTTVDRRHKPQTLPTGDGIQKVWRVSTTNNPGGQNATLRFQYFDSELNGIAEADLIIWRSTNNGASWTDMGRSSNSSTQNYVEQIALTDINGWWTLGAPTPLIGGGSERSTATEKPLQTLNWSIFPNPATEFATVSIPSENVETVVVELLDAKGLVVLKQVTSLGIGENSSTLQIQSLPQGIYFARIAGSQCKPIPFVKICRS